MGMRARYLIVDGHSVIFAWPELRALHERRTSLAREALTKTLRDYQDWSGVHAVVVFDGRGSKVTEMSDPGEIQIFYSRRGQTADSIIERLTAKYAGSYNVMVATSDNLEKVTVTAFGAEVISPDGLRSMVEEVRSRDRIGAYAAPMRTGHSSATGGRPPARQVVRTRERTQ
jgi:predicted RNA-binding protein with PIN domain